MSMTNNEALVAALEAARKSHVACVELLRKSPHAEALLLIERHESAVRHYDRAIKAATTEGATR